MTSSARCAAPAAVSAIVPDEAAGSWKICGFSYFNSDKGNLYCSQPLCEVAGGTFSLILYPGGHHEQPEQSEKISSVYLDISSKVDVWVKYDITVSDKGGKTLYFKQDTFFADSQHRRASEDALRSPKIRGFPEYAKLSFLKKAAEDHDDVLWLTLQIKAWPENPTVKEESYMTKSNVSSCGALAKDLEVLLCEGTATDVALEVSSASDGDQQTLRAHRLMLAARSPVFKQMFYASCMAESSETAVVKIDALEPKAVRWFLHFLYTDKIPEEVSEDDEALCHLLQIADKYQVQPLLEHCVAGIRAKLSDENACERLMMADQLEMTELRSFILSYIGSSRNRIAKLQASDSFARLARQRPALLADILAQAVPPAPKREAAAPDLPEEVQSLSVLRLKQLLSDRGLPTTGNKAALVARLQSALDSTP